MTEEVPTGHPHPAIDGRTGGLAALADAVRSLIGLTVTTAAPDEELDAVAADLRAAAERLAAHRPATPFPRFVTPSREHPLKPTTMAENMAFDVVIGPYNPLALPVEVEPGEPGAVGRARFGIAYEGPPGCVHGAVIAGTFDIVLTAANVAAGVAGPTIRLGLRYRNPTLIDTETRFEAWVDRVDGRRVLTKGRAVQHGEVTVEAEGEFANLDHERIQTMQHGRRRPAEG
ncbi:MAG TPA: hotdog fold domain-containing protein [Acidimicrobiales bacterium]|nr:hotdog fold domain-containing protein [Acidimicrobiales bacterium]